MELSSPRLKNFRKKNVFQFSVQARKIKKIKKICPKRISYIFSKNVFLTFREMEPTCVKNKKFREGTFHAQKPTMKKFIMFQEKKISSSKFIKLLYFSKKERMVPRLKKSSYIFSK